MIIRGFIVSPKATRVYNFLARAGPSPFAAMSVASGLGAGQLAKTLRSLQGAGYASPVKLKGVEYWITDGVAFNLNTQESLSWFAARLEEAGGKYENDQVVFPKGQTMQVRACQDGIEAGEYLFCLADLREKPLRDCFRRKQQQKRSAAAQ